MPQHIIQRLHDSEIDGALEWPIQGKIFVHLGSPVSRDFEAEAIVDTFADAQAWLDQEAIRRSPNGAYARSRRHQPAEPQPSIVQELLDADVAGTASWYFDGAFGATLGDPTGEAPRVDSDATLSSWADCERWLRDQAVKIKRTE